MGAVFNIVNVQQIKVLQTFFGHQFQHSGIHFLTRIGQNDPRGFINDIQRQKSADQSFGADEDGGKAFLLQLFHQTRRHLGTSGQADFTRFGVHQIMNQLHPAPFFGHEGRLPSAFANGVVRVGIKGV